MVKSFLTLPPSLQNQAALLSPLLPNLSHLHVAANDISNFDPPTAFPSLRTISAEGNRLDWPAVSALARRPFTPFASHF
jgi:Leucine-rich repeat (LRR) protein